MTDPTNHDPMAAGETLPIGEPLRGISTVIVSWHGVLFDRDRRQIHTATAGTFARWSVSLDEADLIATRGPAGRSHILRLLAVPRVAESFRARHRRWASEDDIAAMVRDLEPRLLAAAHAAPEPTPETAGFLRALHSRGIRTASICCLSTGMIQPQVAALRSDPSLLDCIVATDAGCEPAPAPWGIYEVARELGVDRPARIAFIDDSPVGATAARNAGTRGIHLALTSHPGPTDAHFTVRSLDELLRD